MGNRPLCPPLLISTTEFLLAIQPASITILIFLNTKYMDVKKQSQGNVERVSLSLPRDVVAGLDEWSGKRGFDSRSQAVASIIRLGLLEDKQEDVDAVMAGSITLFFKQDRPGLLEDLARLKREYIDEVIGSLQVQLADAHLMEVLLVQGPVKTLRAFTDDLVTCKGVKAGSLNLTSELIPPLHPLPRTNNAKKNSKPKTKKQ